MDDEFSDSFLDANNDVDEQAPLQSTMSTGLLKDKINNYKTTTQDQSILSTSKQRQSGVGTPIARLGKSGKAIPKENTVSKLGSKSPSHSMLSGQSIDRYQLMNLKQVPGYTKNTQLSVFQKSRKSENPQVKMRINNDKQIIGYKKRQSQNSSMAQGTQLKQKDFSNEFSNNDFSYFSDTSISKQKDFKAAYKMLEHKLALSSTQNLQNKYINKANALMNNHSMRTLIQSQCKQNQSSSSQLSIHDKLYNEKDRYFETKKLSKDSKLEDEVKQCTFSPNNRTSSSRSFQTLYQDLVTAQQKTNERIKKMRKDRLEEELSQLRSFSSNNSTPKGKTVGDISKKLYEEGMKKVQEVNHVATTKNIGNFDKNYTFKPQINQKTNKITKGRQAQNIIEVLHKEKMHKQKPKTGNNSQSRDSLSQAIKENINSKHCLEQKIEKTIIETLAQLDFDQDKGLNAENLFDLLKLLDYAQDTEQDFINKVFHLVGQGRHLGFEELKTIICGIEGLYLEQFLSDKQLQLQHKLMDQKTPKVVWQLRIKEDFNKFHGLLQRLFINKTQIQFVNKNKEQQAQSSIVKNTFKPSLNRKSLKIEQRKRDSSQSLERNAILLEKGKQYEKTRLQKIEEKSERELVDCSFQPEVNKDFKFHNPDIASRHLANSIERQRIYEELYRLKNKQYVKRNKTKDEIEFEKEQEECTFKPNLDKPNILKLTINNRQPLSLPSALSPKTPGANFAAISPINRSGINEVGSANSSRIINPFLDPMNQQDIDELRKQEIRRRNFMLLTLEDNVQGQLFRDCPPLLFLEVNISEGKQAKLLLYDGDQPEEVVNVFAEVFGLGSAKKQKLLDIVRSQLSKILSNIGEAEEEEDDFTTQGSASRKSTRRR